MLVVGRLESGIRVNGKKDGQIEKKMGIHGIVDKLLKNVAIM